MTIIIPLPSTDPAASPAKPPIERRSRAKIGRLPREIRDQLNQMIQDGVPYEDIKTRLGEHGKDLTVAPSPHLFAHQPCGSFRPIRVNPTNSE